jgi:DNA-binding LacI/PurR family transcriptional regulator
MVSIKDIARVANVSHSTVSRALRNSPLVNAETGALIRKIAMEKGYMVSAVARSLVTRRTNTIGIVVTSIADPFVGEVVGGIEEFALAHGYSVFLATCHADPALEVRAVQSFHERRVDGILVTASRVGALYTRLLSEMKIPIVLINNQNPGEFIFSVAIDNLDGGRQVTRHLVELGHKRIAYIGDQFGFQSEAERYTGYRQILEESGLRFESELITHGDGGPESGKLAMEQLLALVKPPTAVFCYNDMEAIGAMRAARERGLTVPCDISVAGFDDIFLSSYTDPPLTTLRQPKHEMGRDAARLLLELLAGGKPESRVAHGELIVRQSTVAPQRISRG